MLVWARAVERQKPLVGQTFVAAQSDHGILPCSLLLQSILGCQAHGSGLVFFCGFGVWNLGSRALGFLFVIGGFRLRGLQFRARV